MQRFALLLSGLLCLAGCQTFEIPTPADFVEREQPEWGSYGYRALNADAVVLGVREVEEDPEKPVSLAFWAKAVKNKLQASHAYALLGEEELSVASGQKALLLRLGSETSGTQYDYWVTLVDAGRDLFVIEAGGRRDSFAKVADSLRGSIKGFQVK